MSQENQKQFARAAAHIITGKETLVNHSFSLFDFESAKMSKKPGPEGRYDRLEDASTIIGDALISGQRQVASRAGGDTTCQSDGEEEKLSDSALTREIVATVPEIDDNGRLVTMGQDTFADPSADACECLSEKVQDLWVKNKRLKKENEELKRDIQNVRSCLEACVQVLGEGNEQELGSSSREELGDAFHLTFADTTQQLVEQALGRPNEREMQRDQDKPKGQTYSDDRGKTQ
jgi:hypothetical protein